MYYLPFVHNTCTLYSTSRFDYFSSRVVMVGSQKMKQGNNYLLWWFSPNPSNISNSLFSKKQRNNKLISELMISSGFSLYQLFGLIRQKRSCVELQLKYMHHSWRIPNQNRERERERQTDRQTDRQRQRQRQREGEFLNLRN